jgi:hypothetical protein
MERGGLHSSVVRRFDALDRESARVEVAAECFSDDVGRGDTVALGACCNLDVELGVEANRFDGRRPGAAEGGTTSLCLHVDFPR